MDAEDDGLVVYGDYFNQDTRSILAILDIAGVERRFEVVDTFKVENMNEAFTKLSPNGSIPIIKAGKKTVNGDTGVTEFYTYLVFNYTAVSDALYPKD